MRCIWALSAFTFFLHHFRDITRYYSYEGIIPRTLYSTIFRQDFRFSLLDVVTDPSIVYGVYLLLLISLLLCAIGFLPRMTTILSFLLICSFHERNLLVLGGGDTMFRNIGFLLCIAPEIRAFSIGRAKAQCAHWMKHSTLLDPLTMSIWPYRLLLWQMIVIYVASGLSKLTGEMWAAGTAVAPVLLHPHFMRWSLGFMQMLTPYSAFISMFTMLLLLSWMFLLVPRSLIERLPKDLPRIHLKRTLLLGGILFHGGIFVLMDVGSFPAAVAAAYCGLLLDEDRNAIRGFLNNHKRQLTILYDGKCSFCRRSIAILMLLDWLQRLDPQDYHTYTGTRVSREDLEQAMHVIDHQGRITAGFDGFRTIAHHTPLLWILVPVLYIPGVSWIGRRYYRQIATRRHCSIK